MIAGLFLTQILMGGFNLLFSLPGYTLVAVAGVLTLFLSRRRLNTGANMPAVLSALLLAGYVVVRSLTSPVEYLARMDFFMVIAALAVYLFTVLFLKTARQRYWVIYALFGLAVLNTAAGLVQFTKGNQFMLMWYWPDGWIIPKLFRPDYGWRASGFFGCPNYLAGFLETLGLVTLSLCLLGRGRVVARTILGYFLLVCLVGLAITGSRGGYLSLTAGLVFLGAELLWILNKLQRERFWPAMIAAVGLLMALVTVGYGAMSNSAAIEQRLRDVWDKENIRLLLWGAAVKQFQTSPIVGTGSGTYLFYGRQFRLAEVQRDPVHVHNDYLELLAEYGIVGASLVGIFLILHLRSGFRGLRQIVRQRLRPAGRVFSDELALTVGAIAATGSLLAHSVVDFNFHIPANTLYFAFLLGILASPTSDPKIVPEKPTAPIRWLRFGPALLGAAVLLLGTPLLPAECHGEWARVQLRNLLCLEAISTTQAQIHLLSPAVVTGTPLPATSAQRGWAGDFFGTHYLPIATAQARTALEREKQNPNLYYHLGEALRFQAVYPNRDDPAPKPAFVLMKEAVMAYGEGLKLFPQDVRLQMKFAQSLDNLGPASWNNAESIYLRALQSDPNLSELYAQYGYHLFLTRKLLRAEAYYRRALKFRDPSELAFKGLEDIARLRALAASEEYVEQFGNPMDDFDLEPPTEEDEKRGAIEHE
jgi:O-antigen ligase/tetratricopeptide (TPR) repeat protein